MRDGSGRAWSGCPGMRVGAGWWPGCRCAAREGWPLGGVGADGNSLAACCSDGAHPPAMHLQLLCPQLAGPALGAHRTPTGVHTCPCLPAPTRSTLPRRVSVCLPAAAGPPLGRHPGAAAPVGEGGCTARDRRHRARGLMRGHGPCRATPSSQKVRAGGLLRPARFRSALPWLPVHHQLILLLSATSVSGLSIANMLGLRAYFGTSVA